MRLISLMIVIAACGQTSRSSDRDPELLAFAVERDVRPSARIEEQRVQTGEHRAACLDI